MFGVHKKWNCITVSVVRLLSFTERKTSVPYLHFWIWTHHSILYSWGLLELRVACFLWATSALSASLWTHTRGEGSVKKLLGKLWSREASVFPTSLPDLPVQSLTTWASSQRGKVAKIDLKTNKQKKKITSGNEKHTCIYTCILLRWRSLIKIWINCQLSCRSLSLIDSRDRWPRCSRDYLQHGEYRKGWAASFNGQNIPQAAAAQWRHVLYLVRNSQRSYYITCFFFGFFKMSAKTSAVYSEETMNAVM